MTEKQKKPFQLTYHDDGKQIDLDRDEVIKELNRIYAIYQKNREKNDDNYMDRDLTFMSQMELAKKIISAGDIDIDSLFTNADLLVRGKIEKDIIHKNLGLIKDCIITILNIYDPLNEDSPDFGWAFNMYLLCNKAISDIKDKKTLPESKEEYIKYLEEINKLKYAFLDFLFYNYDDDLFTESEFLEFLIYFFATSEW